MPRQHSALVRARGNGSALRIVRGVCARILLFLIILTVPLSCDTPPGNQQPWDASRDLTNELPVFPGAEGFGSTTPAGRGGAILRVTNLHADGPGSLKAALETPEPRIVVFEVAGVIDLVDALVVPHPFITVAGQTAPSPGITLVGAGIVVVTHDVLIQHMRIRPGDRVQGPDPNGRDGITIDGNHNNDACNVVIDHCSVSWALDEGMSTWGRGVHDVTFSNCVSAENLSRSLHPEGEHSKGLLIGDHARRISVIGNLFADNATRNPQIKGDCSVIVVNNLIANPGRECIHFSDPEGSGGSLATIQGNVLMPGRNTRRWFSMIHTEFTVKRNSRVYADGNRVIDKGAGTRKTESIKRVCQAEEPPVTLTPLTVRAPETVPDWILAAAGARPADRDETDARVVENARNGTGLIIDAVAEVGGFPSHGPVYAPLDVPQDPAGDEDADGYTNVEEWLHTLAAQVEGR